MELTVTRCVTLTNYLNREQFNDIITFRHNYMFKIALIDILKISYMYVYLLFYQKLKYNNFVQKNYFKNCFGHFI